MSSNVCQSIFTAGLTVIASFEERTPSSVDARNNVETDPKWWSEYTKKKGWQLERDVNFASIMLGKPVEVDYGASRQG